MKKKIVNVLLSAAVITTMMFSVTACGSKSAADTSANVVQDAAASTESKSAAAPAESTVAESEAPEADGAMALEEWTKSDDCAEFIKMMNEGEEDATFSIEADGDVLCLVYTYNEQLEVEDGAEDAIKEAIDTMFGSFETLFAEIRDELVEETGNENMVLRFEYRNADGTVLYSKDTDESYSKDTDEPKADNNGTMTLEEWTKSDEGIAFIEAVNGEVDDANCFFEVDGDRIYIVYMFDEQIDVADNVEEAMSELFEGYATVFGMARDLIIEQTGNENAIVALEYRNADGTVIFSKDI